MDQRFEALQQWVEQQYLGELLTLEPASADASFRRYFRLHRGDKTAIVMDAPPQQEDCTPFLSIARVLLKCGVHVPEILAEDLQQGFLLLSDLGSSPYLGELDDSSADALYGDAMESLLQMQRRWPKQSPLPLYGHDLLVREMELFREWYLQLHREMEWDADQHSVWNQQMCLLSESAQQQPQVAVHRDYHSRNLMVIEENNPGVIDFQDAVWGAVTYDLVSLLRDCYIDWPRERVEQWAQYYLQRLKEEKMVPDVEWTQFLQWFDWMGVQRHLKAVGIFARLNHRDGKPGYLGDIPRTLGYIQEVSARYPELSGLHGLVAKL